jgi:transcriptional regulator with XRE-family HTH domain
MKNLKKSFGLNLKEIRKSKKYTQESFAEMIDLSPRQLIRIESGKNFPSAETLGKISLALNTSFQNLFNFNLYDDLELFKDTTSKEDLNNNLQSYIITKMKYFSSDKNKLDYIKLAVDSLENKKALEELSLIIKGMELIQ